MEKKFSPEEWDFWDDVIEKCAFPESGLSVFKEDYSVLRWYFDELFSCRPNVLVAVQLHKNCLDAGHDYMEALSGHHSEHLHAFWELTAEEGEEVAAIVETAIKRFKKHPSEGTYSKADMQWIRYFRQFSAVCREYLKKSETSKQD